MFLNADELKELTGYTYYCRQIDWLRSHNWKFEVTAQQRPKVARSYFESRLGGGVASSRGEVELVGLTVKPNFQALNQMRSR
ncbi:DUF4224 domain-containing protein [Undibacterium sp. Di24W]|uniref:DUF4224 domain-containing protein n=1 Tax=Undibacterium sp. Di24W TaxID=3413033 RepID=UPI003BF3D83A